MNDSTQTRRKALTTIGAASFTILAGCMGGGESNSTETATDTVTSTAISLPSSTTSAATSTETETTTETEPQTSSTTETATSTPTESAPGRGLGMEVIDHTPLVIQISPAIAVRLRNVSDSGRAVRIQFIPRTNRGEPGGLQYEHVLASGETIVESMLFTSPLETDTVTGYRIAVQVLIEEEWYSATLVDAAIKSGFPSLLTARDVTLERRSDDSRVYTAQATIANSSAFDLAVDGDTDRPRGEFDFGTVPANGSETFTSEAYLSGDPELYGPPELTPIIAGVPNSASN